jgi:hypothetical protein
VIIFVNFSFALFTPPLGDYHRVPAPGSRRAVPVGSRRGGARGEGRPADAPARGGQRRRVRPARRCRGEQQTGQEERERGPLERREGVEHGPPERVDDQERARPRRLLRVDDQERARPRRLLRAERSGTVEVDAESGEARGPEEVGV